MLIVRHCADACSNVIVAVQVWPSGPPQPTTQDYYEGALTRLVRLLGDTLDYYWIWTPEGWEWNKVSINNPLVQDVVADAMALQVRPWCVHTVDA